MKTKIMLMLALLLALPFALGGCGKKKDAAPAAATKFTADGTVTTGGTAHTVKGCEIVGDKPIEEAAKLTLDDGEIVTMPINEGRVFLSKDPKVKGLELPCPKGGGSSEGGGEGAHYLKGTFEKSCATEAGDVTLQMKLTLECGTKPRSNRKD